MARTVLVLVLVTAATDAKSCGGTPSPSPSDNVIEDCDFETDECGWDNTRSIPWIRGQTTPSSDTGPHEDHTSGSGYFMYVEASANYPSVSVIMTSPELPSEYEMDMTFAYHMYGERMGDLKVQYTTDWDDWSVIWERNGNKGNEWKSATPDGSAIELPKNTSGVRFKAVTYGKTSDMAIDDVRIWQRSPECDDDDYDELSYSYEYDDDYSCGKGATCDDQVDVDDIKDQIFSYSYSYPFYSYGDLPELPEDDDSTCRPYYEMVADDKKCDNVLMVFDCTDGCAVGECKSQAIVAEKGKCLNVGLNEYTKVHHCNSETDFTVKVYSDPRCHHFTGQVWYGTGKCTFEPDYCDEFDDDEEDADGSDNTGTEVSWSTTFTLSGLSASDVTEDDEASILTAIAAASDDTDEEDLEISAIKDTSRRRALSADEVGEGADLPASKTYARRKNTRSLLVSSSIDVSYITTLIVEETEYVDADSLFDSVTNDFEAAVGSGDLEAKIQATASSDSELKSASVDSASFSKPTKYSETTVDLGGDDDVETKVVVKQDNTTLIILGVCVALALAIGGCVGVYCTYKNRSSWLGNVHGQVPMAEAVVELPNFSEQGSRGSEPEPTFNPVNELGSSVARPSGDTGYDPHGGAQQVEKNTLEATWDPAGAEFMTVEATPWSPSSGAGAGTSANPFEVGAIEVGAVGVSSAVVSADAGQAYSI